MSPREQVQQLILAELESCPEYWTAPYGILEGMYTMKNGGKIRTITFGVARYLDAEIQIWSPKKIVITGQGGLAYKVEGTYTSVEETIAVLRDAAHWYTI